ncbi:MAG: hypothetical protein LBG78_02880 [Azoarcus sp.]|nr:hypothetical protein [Azoarcus sp.]
MKLRKYQSKFVAALDQKAMADTSTDYCYIPSAYGLNLPMVTRFIISLVIYFFCEGVMAQQTDNIQNVLDKIRENRVVERIEIIHLQYSVLTRTSVTPEMLEKFYSYKLNMDSSGVYFYLPSFIKALDKTSINKTETEYGFDSRWGILFFDAKNERIASIYMDGFMVNGYINLSPVSFNSNPNEGLVWWLKENFSSVFKDSLWPPVWGEPPIQNTEGN